MKSRSSLFACMVGVFFLLGACSPPVVSPEKNEEKVGSDGGANNPDVPEPTRCVGNNDGIIDLKEVSFVSGVSVNVRRNKEGTSVSVNQVGKKDANGQLVWDFRTLKIDTSAKVETLAPGRFWFASSFPGATLLVPERFTGFTGRIFQVIRKAGNDVLLDGLVSEKEKPDAEKVLLSYDTPVPLLQFPLREGKEWVVTAKASGVLGGIQITSTDRYQIRVDGRGKLQLPDIEFENTLRVVLQIHQRFLGGKSRRLIQVLYMHECYGEVARVESKDDETDPEFSSAALARHISF